MSVIKMTVHRIEQGVCSLSEKDGEVLVVSFEDGTITEGALSQKALMQLIRMKLAVKKPQQPAQALPVNGPVVVKQ